MGKSDIDRFAAMVASAARAPKPQATERKAKPTPDPPTQWDKSTPEQRRNRNWQMTERGVWDSATGKFLNPNGVKAPRFAGILDKLASEGHLEQRQVEAAEDYERLCRAVYGSPAQRSCLDIGAVGYDDEPDNSRERAELTIIERHLGLFQRAELVRVIWEGHQTVRLPLLSAGLTVVADHFRR